jgi:hypothetical protein
LLSEKQKLAHVLDRPEGCRIAMKTSEVRLKSGDRALQDERSGSMVSSQALAAYIVGSTFVLDAPYIGHSQSTATRVLVPELRYPNQVRELVLE